MSSPACLPAVAVLMVGCLPYTSVVTSPDLQGVTHEDGRPAAVPVLAAKGLMTCDPVLRQAASDSLGRFHLERTRHGWWHSPFAVYRLAPRDWTFCTGRTAGADTVWTPLLTARDEWGAPARRLDCDLSRGTCVAAPR